MANPSNSKSFRESLKVKKPIDHSKAQAAAKSKAKASSNTPGQKGNQGRTRGGMTR